MSTISDVFRGRMDSDRTALFLLEHMIWPILVVVAIGIYIFVPQTFKNLRSLELVMFGSVPLGLLVLAESLCLLSGHFDLSIGAIAGFSAMTTGMVLGGCLSCWGLTINPLVGYVLIFAIAGAIGVINGVMITKLNVNPFLQTLSALIVFEGAKKALNTQPISGLPSAYLYPGSKPWLAISVLLTAFFVFGLILRYTEFGQAIYVIGSDKESAREVGINTDRMVITVYLLSGLLAGLAGLMLTGFIGVVPPGAGEGQVFPAFAGAVIGGISLFGGRGKVSGALGGVVLLGIIQAALNISGVPATQVQMVNGLILVGAILLYNTQSTFRSRILSSGEPQ